MARRLLLQSLLEELLGTGNVYYQAPVNREMHYPAIVYNRDYAVTEFAGNLPYKNVWRWSVTVMDRDPDSDIPDKVLSLPMCTFNRHFVADKLNHDVFSLYF